MSILLSHLVQTKANRTRIKVSFQGDTPAVQRSQGGKRKVVRGKRRSGKSTSDTATSPPGPGMWFCCLMKQLDGQCKNETSIQVSQKPLETVYQHNAGTANDKSTKAARGHWMPEMLVGPLPSQKDAELFKKQWMQKSRGIVSKRDFGKLQAREWRETYPALRCFDKRLVPCDYNDYVSIVGMPELRVSNASLVAMKKRLQQCIRKT